MKKKGNNYGSQVLEVIGVKPFILIIIGLAIFFINQLCSMIYQVIIGTSTWAFPISKIIDIFSLTYFVMLVITAMMLLLEKDKLNINEKMKIKALFFNPFYLITYIPCAIKAVLKKEVVWDKISHTKTMAETN